MVTELVEAPAETGSPDPAEVRSTPAYLILVLAGIALEIFSGWSSQIGFPIGPDRLCFTAGLVLLLLDPAAFRQVRLRVRAVHRVLVAVLVIATYSAFDAGTLTDRTSLFALIDRLGALPFAMFTLAPVVFATAWSRELLMRVLTGVGLYLAVISCLEQAGATALIFPSYIYNPNLGIHVERARGPFLEAVANGLSMFICAVAAGMALAVWRRTSARLLALTVIGLSTAGILFTVTRAVWIGAAAGVVVAFLSAPRLRKVLIPVAGLSAVTVVLLLALVPGLQASVTNRTGDSRSTDDRLNANAAAIRVVEAKPLTGVGWNRFASIEDDYVRQADTYPITATGIAVHNVPLGHAAEIGLPGAALWVLAFCWAVGGGCLRRLPGDSPLRLWRTGLIAVAVAWVIVANLGPLGYAFPNLMIWMWAGIVSAPALVRVPSAPAAAAASTGS